MYNRIIAQRTEVASDMTSKWVFGVSVKKISLIDTYLSMSERFEVDMRQCCREFSSDEEFIEKIKPIRKNIYSYHLRYSSKKLGIGQELSFMDVTIRDVEMLANAGLIGENGATSLVAHSEYPKSKEEFMRQLFKLRRTAEKYQVQLLIENLPDRTNKTSDYYAPRSPKEIADILEEINSGYLGLCLDTGHAICNSTSTESMDWDTPNTYKWVKHFHYHSSLPGQDLHLPIDNNTYPALIQRFKKLCSGSQNKGVAIFENVEPEDSQKSLIYTMDEEYKEISS